MFLKPSNRNDFSLKLTDLPVFLRLQVINNICAMEQRKFIDAHLHKLESALKHLQPNNAIYKFPENTQSIFQSAYQFSNDSFISYEMMSTELRQFLIDYGININSSKQKDLKHTHRSWVAFILGSILKLFFEHNQSFRTNLYKEIQNISVSAYGDALYQGTLVSNSLTIEVDNQLFNIYSKAPVEIHPISFIFSCVYRHEMWRDYLLNLDFSRSREDTTPFYFFYKGLNQHINSDLDESELIPVRAAIVGHLTDRFISCLNYTGEDVFGDEDKDFNHDLSGSSLIREHFWTSIVTNLHSDRILPATETLDFSYLDNLASKELTISNISEYIRSKTVYTTTAEVTEKLAISSISIDEFVNGLEKDQAAKSLLSLADIPNASNCDELKSCLLNNVLVNNHLGYKLSLQFVEKIAYAVFFVEKYLSTSSKAFLRTEDILSVALTSNNLEKVIYIHPDLLTSNKPFPLLSQIYGVNFPQYLKFEIYLSHDSNHNLECRLCIDDKLIEEIF